VSISSTFYLRFFCQYFGAKNLKPKTQLCNSWHQNIGAKCMRKMLMKSTPAFSKIDHPFKMIKRNWKIIIFQNHGFWSVEVNASDNIGWRM